MGGVFRKHEKMRNVDTIFVRKCAMKKQLAKRRDSWKENVKINLSEKITILSTFISNVQSYFCLTRNPRNKRIILGPVCPHLHPSARFTCRATEWISKKLVIEGVYTKRS